MPKSLTEERHSADSRLEELTQRLIAAGCFDTARLRYALRCLAICAALSVAFIGLLAGPEWPVRIVLIVLAVFACVQAAFIAHDIGDGALAASNRVSETLRQFLLTFACGTSSTYFHHVHRLHHLSLERRGRSGSRQRYVKNRYELHWLKRLLAWDGRFFMIGTIALRGFTFRIESIRFVLANATSTRVDQVVLIAHYAFWTVLPATVLGWGVAILNLALITLLAGAYIGTVLVLNHEGMSRADEVAELAPFERVLATTRNLPASGIADLLLGGVNNHIEHHLFPDLPTMRLPKARQIVKGFCEELGLGYAETSVAAALRSAGHHFTRASRQRLVLEALS
jgi:fatty acid desaturase